MYKLIDTCYFILPVYGYIGIHINRPQSERLPIQLLRNSVVFINTYYIQIIQSVTALTETTTTTWGFHNLVIFTVQYVPLFWDHTHEQGSTLVLQATLVLQTIESGTKMFNDNISQEGFQGIMSCLSCFPPLPPGQMFLCFQQTGQIPFPHRLRCRRWG